MSQKVDQLKNQIHKQQTKIVSLRSAVNYSAGISEQFPTRMQDDQQQQDRIKEKIEDNKLSTQSLTSSQQIWKKKYKYKLNVDTDSDEDFTTRKGGHQDLFKIKEGLDADIRHGTEQAKAKQNAYSLFGDVFGQQKTQKSSNKTSTGSNFEKGSRQSFNTQIMGDKDGSSLSQAPPQQDNSKKAKLHASYSNIQYGEGMNNSYFEDPEEDVCFLKGLSQNQNLENNCELSEYLDNDKINISIKTTDFFTFIRLEDEVDELRRKHFDLQNQKQVVAQQQKQQQQKMMSEHEHKQQTNASGFLDKRKINEKINDSRENEIPPKQDEENFYALCRVIKFCKLMKNKAVNNVKNNKNKNNSGLNKEIYPNSKDYSNISSHDSSSEQSIIANDVKESRI